MSESPEARIDQGYRAVVAAVIACLSATDGADLEFRRTQRDFDPAWLALKQQVAAYAVLMRASGAAIEEVIASVKSAVLEGGPDLPPHNAVRSAAIGWCVASFHGAVRPRTLGLEV